MTVPAIAAVELLLPAATPGQAQAAAPPSGGFGAWFAQEVAQVNSRLEVVEHETRRLALGEPVSLHEVMIHMEEAKLSFQLLAQVRSRMLEAYQEVIRMQV